MQYSRLNVRSAVTMQGSVGLSVDTGNAEANVVSSWESLSLCHHRLHLWRQLSVRESR